MNTALITGAGRGIGLATARAFVKAGWRVLALDKDAIKPAPEMSSAVDTSFITGIGCVKSGDEQRMLILMDIEGLMASEEMGLINSLN